LLLVDFLAEAAPARASPVIATTAIRITVFLYIQTPSLKRKNLEFPP
jgi:hypothetical protein